MSPLRFIPAALSLALCACAVSPEPLPVRLFPTARYAFFQSPRGGGHASGYAICIDALGRIVVAGSAEDRKGKIRVALWRFEDAGRLDTEFGDRGFAMAQAEGAGRVIEFSDDGSIRVTAFDGPAGPVSVRFDSRGGVSQEREVPDAKTPAAPAPPFDFPLENGALDYGVAASARTGRVLRFAGFVKMNEAVRAALWGVKGSESRIRLLPGGDGGEDRAMALAAYENGRLAAAGFSRGAGGKRRLAIWTVP